MRRYPLAVKLGTITAKGADVYSYDPLTAAPRPNTARPHTCRPTCRRYAADEDDMVKDPWLAEHLLRFGIDIMCVMECLSR